jgi:hypothetical protein
MTKDYKFSVAFCEYKNLLSSQGVENMTVHLFSSIFFSISDLFARQP